MDSCFTSRHWSQKSISAVNDSPVCWNPSFIRNGCLQQAKKTGIKAILITNNVILINIITLPHVIWKNECQEGKL